MRDAVVYNMGDYLPFHGHMHAVAQRDPGVVILHDRVLHHLYAGMWLNNPEPDRETYVERMRAYYGDAGAEIARASLEGERPPVWESDEEVLRYPLYEEGIRRAHGVVTHSESQARDVRSRWLGPVRALHLPCYGDVLRRADGAPPRESDGPVHLLTVGHLNPNKQVHRVVEMLAADSELAARVHYTVVGPDDGFKAYVSDLRSLIARHAGRVSVEILGWRPEIELDRLMAQADVFVNLRHPVMEGSSASLMRQLAYGRPILCFESGFFGELPEGAVARVPTGDFRAADEALRRLVGGLDRRRALGERARALATSYSERSYAEGLLQLIEESRLAAPALQLPGFGCAGAGPHERGQQVAHLRRDRERLCPHPRCLIPVSVLSTCRLRSCVSKMWRLTTPTRSWHCSSATRFLRSPRRSTHSHSRTQRRDGSRSSHARTATTSPHAVRIWLGCRCCAGSTRAMRSPASASSSIVRARAKASGARLTAWTIEQAYRRGCPAVRLSVYADNCGGPRSVRLAGIRGAGAADRRAQRAANREDRHASGVSVTEDGPATHPGGGAGARGARARVRARLPGLDLDLLQREVPGALRGGLRGVLRRAPRGVVLQRDGRRAPRAAGARGGARRRGDRADPHLCRHGQSGGLLRRTSRCSSMRSRAPGTWTPNGSQRRSRHAREGSSSFTSMVTRSTWTRSWSWPSTTDCG